MEKFFYLRHLCEIFELNVFVVFGNCNDYDNGIYSHPILSVIILVIGKLDSCFTFIQFCESLI